MSCNHPMSAFDTGTLTSKGKPCYFIDVTGGKLVNCSYLERKGYHIGASAHVKLYQNHPCLVDPVPIPCGHCIGCRMDKAKSWSMRACLESTLWPSSWFITLTYKDACVPQLYGQPSLCLADLQKFWKRLRKYSGFEFRYLACGEYGEHTLRPHYHAIVFGDPFGAVFKNGVWKSSMLNRCWPFGITDIVPSNINNICYVAGYVEKKQILEEKSFPVAPFLKMSRKPGLGFGAIDVGAAAATRRVYGNFGKNHSGPLPKTFISRLDALGADHSEIDEILKFAAKAGQVAQKCYFQSVSQDVVGFALDSIKRSSLEDKRKEKF